MNAEKIKARINEMCTLFGFEYNGKEGNVDPCYSHSDKQYNFLLFFDGEEQIVHSIEDVMNTPFIDGKTLTEVAEKIEIIEW